MPDGMALFGSHSPTAHSPTAHMGTHKKKPFTGQFSGQPYRKHQKQLVEAGLCRHCGDPLGRAKTICDTCANRVAAAAAEAYAADKAAERKEAEKNSPLLAPSELQALPQLATGKDAIKGVKERGNVSGGGVGGVGVGGSPSAAYIHTYSKQAAQARLEGRAAHRAHQGAAHLQQQQPPPSRAG
jgi:hypothetical protein